MSALCQRLDQPSKKVELVRPCILGDGITDAVARTSPPSDSPVRVVPASGAATRMFQALRQANATDLNDLKNQIDQGESGLAPAWTALQGWSGLALGRALPDTDPSTDLPGTLDALRESGIADLPKGLVPFHLHGNTHRTALEGHLREAAVGRTGDVHLHFTAPEDHLQTFKDHIAHINQTVAPELGVHFHVELSVQHPSTDTPALRDDGSVVRHPDGTPFVRPGGHGALLQNLDAMSGLIRIINIDNLAHEDHRVANRPWGNALVQALLDLREEQRSAIERALAGRDLPQIRSWLAEFGWTGDPDQGTVLADLDRPLRVAAVVPSDGQPGGGPFWVRDEHGRITAQIVEGVEVDEAPDQQAIWNASTHFNPVDIVCWLNNADGAPHDLTRFVDNSRWIRTRKHVLGAPARCLERPGLWNGSMGGWLTRFVAVPRATFNPVKTVANLLDERHRPVG
ncbi:MAG: DUF4301 family protein [Myxococcota bacterium]